MSNFELHRGLFGTTHEEKLYRYYKDVKSRLVKDEGNNYGFHFTDEDFYLYTIAHEYKHYSIRGNGLRSLLDTYVYLQKKTALNFSYIEEETERLGITDFERMNRALALHLFSGEKLTDEEREILDYLLSSGTYGTLENGIRHKISSLGRWGYLKDRVFFPMDRMKENYPVLRRLPVLLPVCWVHRWFVGLFIKRKKMMLQAREIIRWKSEK